MFADIKGPYLDCFGGAPTAFHTALVQAHNTTNSAYQFAFSHLEWLNSHNTK